MSGIERYSEPYSATGGLAAEGVVNQLGRPDIDPLEVLVREAVQNCWDAKRPDAPRIRVEICRRTLDAAQLAACVDQVLVDPPPSLPLKPELHAGLQILSFADFGTEGLGGPTRADRTATKRDFVDFVRNIGQPPDKELGGGSYGYGKAAFYIASRARTIFVDTLCLDDVGVPERRFIACGLGENFEVGGAPYTGRHWWGRDVGGVPEPLVGEPAIEVASHLGLPPRTTKADLGTTVAVVAPNLQIITDDDEDETMQFVAEALVWNFWPRLLRGPGVPTMEFKVRDGEQIIRLPDPRVHPRLRGFAEAMDRQREEPDADADELVFDRSIDSLRPARHLGRLVITKGVTTRLEEADRPVPLGARQTSDSVHHVALMRNAELVVQYLEGPAPIAPKVGYTGVFRCAVDVDHAFRASEPPTHDKWIPVAVRETQERTVVNVALTRIRNFCREAAGYSSSGVIDGDSIGIPLGEFADTLASLMPGSPGPGARDQTKPGRGANSTRPRPRRAPGRTVVAELSQDVWETADIRVVGSSTSNAAVVERSGLGPELQSSESGQSSVQERRAPPPRIRSAGDPEPTLTDDHRGAMRYPFELRTFGSGVRLRAAVEIMSSDGAKVETEAPAGVAEPSILGWIDPSSVVHRVDVMEIPPASPESQGSDGPWSVVVTIADEAMMRVDITAEQLA